MSQVTEREYYAAPQLIAEEPAKDKNLIRRLFKDHSIPVTYQFLWHLTNLVTNQQLSAADALTILNKILIDRGKRPLSGSQEFGNLCTRLETLRNQYTLIDLSDDSEIPPAGEEKKRWLEFLGREYLTGEVDRLLAGLGKGQAENLEAEPPQETSGTINASSEKSKQTGSVLKSQSGVSKSDHVYNQGSTASKKAIIYTKKTGTPPGPAPVLKTVEVVRARGGRPRGLLNPTARTLHLQSRAQIQSQPQKKSLELSSSSANGSRDAGDLGQIRLLAQMVQSLRREINTANEKERNLKTKCDNMRVNAEYWRDKFIEAHADLNKMVGLVRDTVCPSDLQKVSRSQGWQAASKPLSPDDFAVGRQATRSRKENLSELVDTVDTSPAAAPPSSKKKIVPKMTKKAIPSKKNEIEPPIFSPRRLRSQPQSETQKDFPTAKRGRGRPRLQRKPKSPSPAPPTRESHRKQIVRKSISPSPLRESRSKVIKPKSISPPSAPLAPRRKSAPAKTKQSEKKTKTSNIAPKRSEAYTKTVLRTISSRLADKQQRKEIIAGQPKVKIAKMDQSFESGDGDDDDDYDEDLEDEEFEDEQLPEDDEDDEQQQVDNEFQNF